MGNYFVICCARFSVAIGRLRATAGHRYTGIWVPLMAYVCCASSCSVPISILVNAFFLLLSFHFLGKFLLFAYFALVFAALSPFLRFLDYFAPSVYSVCLYRSDGHVALFLIGRSMQRALSRNRRACRRELSPHLVREMLHASCSSSEVGRGSRASHPSGTTLRFDIVRTAFRSLVSSISPPGRRACDFFGIVRHLRWESID